MYDVNSEAAIREKKLVALGSIIAAIGLTLIKITVGLITGSLGILAEAAHSALDLVAAVVTYFAVRIAGKPADAEHLYGHGKVENVSALFETLLLLTTCVWIIHEAYVRLFEKIVPVDASVWAFLVMAVSIIVDISRSRALYRTAKKYKSQALEADALHFRTDIWSSCVVIFGLLCVKAGDWLPQYAFMHKADTIAAIGVSLIVVYVSIELGVRSLRALLDTAPKGMVEKIIKIVEAIPGVENIHRVRVRESGSRTFIDAHILVDGEQTLEQVHQLTDTIEKAIHNVIANGDVTVHPEPKPKKAKKL
ncbi:cation transporter [candidate division KSB1 bacterium]|nr:cation transporter [candidate division KSB1 bacterium]